jgi:hypothetical protein
MAPRHSLLPLQMVVNVIDDGPLELSNRIGLSMVG